MAGPEKQTFAGYEIITKLGQGGMGAVYKARQPALDRLIALKVMASDLATDRDFVARFKREASAAASLSHPNVVQVYSAGESEGTHYIAMEFVDGQTLRDHIEQNGRLDPREAIAITVYVAEALQYAWNRAKLIHRDIKPENIFLSKAGEVKVGDLGLAKTVGGQTTSLTQTGTAMGSPHYISPEQATGAKEIDFRTDLYSLGGTLYHMLTGQTPYSGDSSMVVMMKHVNEPPPAIFKVWPQCPMPLGLLVGKMLAKNRSSRPASYEELIEQLRALHDKLKPATVPAAAPVSPSDPTQLLTPTPKPAPAPAQPTPKPVVAGTPKPAKSVFRDLRFVIGAGVTVVLLLGGLFLWSPWKGPGSAGILPASSELQSGPAGRMPALPAETAASPKFGVLFDGRDTSAWQQRDGGDCQWEVKDGALVAGQGDLDTREKFQDFKLHIEFAVPRDAKQGNSGIYIQGRYELQILDSFGKPADDGCCGSIFRLKAPAENASKPPDEWQTFDIGFRAAQFDAAGVKTANARVSVLHNGKLIHDYVEIPKSTGKGEPESAAPGPIRLQSYGSPVRFRNISIRPVEEAASPVAERASVQPGAPSPAASDVVNLLALASVPRDAVYGNWSVTADGLAVQRVEGATALEFPYDAPEEYDYEIEFTPQGNGMNVNQYLSAGGHAFAWKLNSHGVSPPLYGFELLDGKYAKDHLPEAAVQKPMPIESGKRYTSKIEVRRGSLRALVNGEEYVTWSGDFNRLSMEPHTKMKDERHLGVGSWRRGVVFHRAEVRKVGPTAGAGDSAPAAAWQNAINLLPLIDPQKDTVHGTWTFENGDLVSDKVSQRGRIEIPYRPPTEYDLRVTFTRREGADSPNVILAQPGRQFLWEMDAYSEHVFGFSRIDGTVSRDNPSGVKRSKGLENGRQYKTVVQVRNGQLKAYLDDELIAQWSGDPTRLSFEEIVKLHHADTLGLVTWESPVAFHKIELLEITGKGTFTRGTPVK